MVKRQFFDERKSKVLELKSSLPKFEALIKSCIAFANGVGGRIVIGLEDKTKEICGINETIRKRVYDEFPNSLYDSTSPSLLAQIEDSILELVKLRTRISVTEVMKYLDVSRNTATRKLS